MNFELEQEQQMLQLKQGMLELAVGPFEIVTLKLYRSRIDSTAH